MKAKIIGYSIELVITGVGVVVARYGDALAWMGFILIGGGIIAIVTTALWNKMVNLIPLRIVRRGKASRNNLASIQPDSPTAKYGWLEGLVNDQWHNPTNYLYSRLIKIFPSPSATEIGIVVEWFNCSIFDMKFESVKGEIKMGEVKSDPQSLGHQITLVNEPTLNACKSCTCTCYVQVLDGQKTDQFRDAIAKNRALIWGLNLNWKLSTIGFPYRTIPMQQAPPEVITIVPSRS